ncbi:MAG: exosortase-associated EpsI family protein [Verrucomicrobia bacterium]|nr:exosortase-associated EpsI family protein [Verrucomicrobiota bacterium]MCF7708267.1 exosortase-associated EpsI family protein [Verrucomicrobiota bacterium]
MKIITPSALYPLSLSILILVLWAWPAFWYAQDAGGDYGKCWLSGNNKMDDWEYRPVPVSDVAERILVADRIFNGEFRNARSEVIRVFSAKRYDEKPHDIGLFVHTPDRCWTEAGWRIEPVAGETVAISVEGLELVMERRVFTAGARRELVYFGGMVGGEPLPFRLDHNLSVGERYGEDRSRTGAFLRAIDGKYWRRVWDAFITRRPMYGPKQFIRVSTTIGGDTIGDCDKRLEDFLEKWLERCDYEEELDEWQSSRHAGEGGGAV